MSQTLDVEPRDVETPEMRGSRSSTVSKPSRVRGGCQLILATPVLLSLVALLCAAVSYLGPYYIAKAEHVLHGEEVRKKALEAAKKRLSTDVEFESSPIGALVRREEDLEFIRRQVEPITGSPLGLRRLDKAGKAVDAYDKLHPRPKVEVRFLGFLESRVHYLYFCAFFFLGCHVIGLFAERRDEQRFVLFSASSTAPGDPGRRSQCVVAAAAWLAMFAGWHVHNQIRATDLTDHGRMVYSFVHLDIGPWSYELQIARSLLVCLLIGVSCAWSWRRRQLVAQNVVSWTSDASDATSENGRPLLPKCLHSRVMAVKAAFHSWQMHSLCLAAAFLPWTYYYWSLQDSRYLMSNLMLQVIWGITWYVATLPALHAASALECYRGALIRHLINHGPADEELIRAVRDDKPISFAGAAGSAIAAVATYLLPILHKVFG